MISSIFGKTKPINFIILAAYLFLYLVLSQYLLFRSEITFSAFALSFWIFVLLVFTIFLIDFISRKNNLSGNNAYSILLFTVWIPLFPQIFKDPNIISAHIFILLAIRRLLHLRDGSAVKQKIFDASLFAAVATLFFPWAILYFILVYSAIVFYAPGDYRHWLIPFIAVLTILILRYTYFLWFGNTADFLGEYQFEIQWKNLAYLPENYFLPFAFLSVTGIVSIAAYTVNVIRKRAKKQTAFYVIITALILGISTALFFGNENQTNFIFIIFPISVLTTHFLERIKKKRLKEILLWLFLLIPVIFLIAQHRKII